MLPEPRRPPSIAVGGLSPTQHAIRAVSDASDSGGGVGGGSAQSTKRSGGGAAAVRLVELLPLRLPATTTAPPRSSGSGEENDSNAAPVPPPAAAAAAPQNTHHQQTRTWCPRERERGAVRQCRRRVFIAASGAPSSTAGLVVSIVISVAIAVSIASMCAATLPAYRREADLSDPTPAVVALQTIDLVVSALFLFEFVVRLATVSAAHEHDVSPPVPDDDDDDTTPSRPSPNNAEEPPGPAWCGGHPFPRAVVKTLAFVLRPMTLVDIASFLPMVVDQAAYGNGGSGGMSLPTSGLRVLRVTRVVLLLKVGRRSDALRVLQRTVRGAMTALGLMLGYVLIVAIFFAALMFYCEGGDWDAAEGAYMRPTSDGRGMEATPFQSMLHAAYFVIVTMTTVGYGDMVPTTSLGRLLAAGIMMCGVLTLTLPISVITARFPLEYAKLERRRAMHRRQQRSRLRQGIKSIRLATVAASVRASADPTSSPAPKDAVKESSSSRGGRGGGGGDMSSPADSCSSPSPAPLPSMTPMVSPSRDALLGRGEGGVATPTPSPTTTDRDAVMQSPTLTAELDEPPSMFELADALRSLMLEVRRQGAQNELRFRELAAALPYCTSGNGGGGRPLTPVASTTV